MSVPQPYIGLWRRQAIWRSNGSCDTSTRVLWFQAELYHIDLRIPADRPVLAGVGELSQLAPIPFERFAAQIAFAGVTVVEEDRCEWRPEIAFPEVSASLDAGLMRFDAPDRLHEAGIDGSYEEAWERIAAGPVQGLRLVADNGAVAYVLESADWLAWAFGHPQASFPTTPHWTDISFARREGTRWRVDASNMGWREGSFTEGVQREGATLRLPFSPLAWTPQPTLPVPAPAPFPAADRAL
jgi:hypothetical protein